MEQKKYMSVVRYGHKTTVDVLKPGDFITIEEKIDGSNASFMIDGDKIRAFSRNTELDEHNTLSGFYEWTQKLDPKKLLNGVIYFGEWTNPRKIKYPNFEKQFFLFDLYSTFSEKYMSSLLVEIEADINGFNLVPIFYKGQFISFDHLKSFVGKTNLGGKLGDKEIGEGIVVKNFDYKDPFGNQLFVKLVVDEFREVQQQKAPKDPNFKSAEQFFIEEVLTKPRVEKQLYKLVDEGLLDPHFVIEDMGTILKNIGDRIFDDIMKEEGESLQQYEEKDIKRAIGRRTPVIIKEIINDLK